MSNDSAELLRTNPAARRSAREGTRRALARLALVQTTAAQRVRILGGSALEAAALEASHPPCHPDAASCGSCQHWARAEVVLDYAPCQLAEDVRTRAGQPACTRFVRR